MKVIAKDRVEGVVLSYSVMTVKDGVMAYVIICNI